MSTKRQSFWDIEPSSKINVLREKRHKCHIVAALCDPNTGIECLDAETFILYGPDEALLVKPQSFSMRMGLFTYLAFLKSTNR
jgi:hypothetical protein